MDNHFQHYMYFNPVMDDYTPAAVIDQDVLWDVVDHRFTQPSEMGPVQSSDGGIHARLRNTHIFPAIRDWQRKMAPMALQVLGLPRSLEELTPRLLTQSVRTKAVFDSIPFTTSIRSALGLEPTFGSSH
jgi:hypothetical protein